MTSRLIKIIEEFSNGNQADFAKMCGIPPSTLHGYVKGKIPKSEYLVRIFEECGVSTTWLLTGIGPKYLDDREGKKEGYSNPLLNDIEAWLLEQKEGQEGEEEDINAWFRVQFGKSFPEFKEWLKKRDEAISQAAGRQAA